MPTDRQHQGPSSSTPNSEQESGGIFSQARSSVKSFLSNAFGLSEQPARPMDLGGEERERSPRRADQRFPTLFRRQDIVRTTHTIGNIDRRKRERGLLSHEQDGDLSEEAGASSYPLNNEGRRERSRSRERGGGGGVLQVDSSSAVPALRHQGSRPLGAGSADFRTPSLSESSRQRAQSAGQTRFLVEGGGPAGGVPPRNISRVSIFKPLPVVEKSTVEVEDVENESENMGDKRRRIGTSFRLPTDYLGNPRRGQPFGVPFKRPSLSLKGPARQLQDSMKAAEKKTAELVPALKEKEKPEVLEGTSEQQQQQSMSADERTLLQQVCEKLIEDYFPAEEQHETKEYVDLNGEKIDLVFGALCKHVGKHPIHMFAHLTRMLDPYAAVQNDGASSTNKGTKTEGDNSSYMEVDAEARNPFSGELPPISHPRFGNDSWNEDSMMSDGRGTDPSSANSVASSVMGKLTMELPKAKPAAGKAVFHGTKTDDEEEEVEEKKSKKTAATTPRSAKQAQVKKPERRSRSRSAGAGDKEVDTKECEEEKKPERVVVDTKEGFWKVQIEAVYRKRNPKKLDSVAKLMAKYKGNEIGLYAKVCEQYGLDSKKLYANAEAWGEEKDMLDDEGEGGEGGPGAADGGPASCSGLGLAPSGSGSIFGTASGSGSIFGGGPPVSESIFGSTAAKKEESTSSIFGAPKSDGNAAAASIFGGPKSDANAAAASIFGAPKSDANAAAASIFGAPKSDANAAASIFGAPKSDAHAAAASIFGAPKSDANAAAASIFGAPKSGGSAAAGSIFGAPKADATASIFGAPPKKDDKGEPKQNSIFGAAPKKSEENSIFGSSKSAKKEEKEEQVEEGAAKRTKIFGTLIKEEKKDEGFSSIFAPAASIFGDPTKPSIFASPAAGGVVPKKDKEANGNEEDKEDTSSLFGGTSQPLGKRRRNDDSSSMIACGSPGTPSVSAMDETLSAAGSVFSFAAPSGHVNATGGEKEASAKVNAETNETSSIFGTTASASAATAAPSAAAAATSIFAPPPSAGAGQKESTPTEPPLPVPPMNEDLTTSRRKRLPSSQLTSSNPDNWGCEYGEPADKKEAPAVKAPPPGARKVLRAKRTLPPRGGPMAKGAATPNFGSSQQNSSTAPSSNPFAGLTSTEASEDAKPSPFAGVMGASGGSGAHEEDKGSKNPFAGLTLGLGSSVAAAAPVVGTQEEEEKPSPFAGFMSVKPSAPAATEAAPQQAPKSTPTTDGVAGSSTDTREVAKPDEAGAGDGDTSPKKRESVVVETNEDFWKVQIEAVYRKRNPKKLPMVAKLMEKYKGNEIGLYAKVCEQYGLDSKKLYANAEAWGEEKDMLDEEGEGGEGGPGAADGAPASSSGLGLAPSGSGSIFGTSSGSVSIFGTQPSASSGSIFGAPQSTDGNAAAASIFGAPQPKADAPTSIFGTQPKTDGSTAAASIFGTQPKADAPTSIFGTQPKADAPTSIFGTQPKKEDGSAATASIFGAPQTDAKKPGESIFGAPPPSAD